MKRPITDQETVIRAVMKQEIGNTEAATLLGCTKRTLRSYLRRYLVHGRVGLIDHRGGNHRVLTVQQINRIVRLKQANRWRSPRNIRDHLELAVHERTVWQILRQHGLTQQNTKRVKPIVRFEAEYPNQLWQTDIMGKIHFPVIGDTYLIATLDDHSRFVPAGKWFKTQGKMNVFVVWYESLSHYGLPEAMLQDEGSQYKARQRFGQADYEWYANQLGIKLIFAKRAQTKGKIERFWKFVQSDFVPSVWSATTIEQVNGWWRKWLAWYNYKFKSPYFDKETHAARYRPSDRRLKRVELETLLLVEERRKVSRESTISLYGKQYRVPPGYIGCRIWVQIKGDRLCMYANGHVFWRTRLRLS